MCNHSRGAPPAVIVLKTATEAPRCSLARCIIRGPTSPTIVSSASNRKQDSHDSEHHSQVDASQVKIFG